QDQHFCHQRILEKLKLLLRLLVGIRICAGYRLGSDYICCSSSPRRRHRGLGEAKELRV
ncbi:9481_t:CDS:2, partial [Paraglomus occultum]